MYTWHVHLGDCVMAHNGGQKTTVWHPFFPFTLMWHLDIKVRLSDLCSRQVCLLSLLIHSSYHQIIGIYYEWSFTSLYSVIFSAFILLYIISRMYFCVALVSRMLRLQTVRAWVFSFLSDQLFQFPRDVVTNFKREYDLKWYQWMQILRRLDAITLKQVSMNWHPTKF